MSKKQYELQDGRYILIDSELGIHFEEEFSFSALPSFDQCKDSPEFEVIVNDEGDVLEVYSLQEGLRHGPALHYHQGNALKWEAYYKNGLLHGPSKYMSEKGSLLSVTWYYEGREEGIAYQYSIHGALHSKLSFKKARMHGRQEYYYEDGTLKSSLFYENGVLHGDVELFYEDGSLKRNCHFIHGKKEGWDKIYSQAKVILDEGAYVNGLQVGLHIRRYPSGKVREEIFYHSPTRYDKKEWDEKGELKQGESRGPSV